MVEFAIVSLLLFTLVFGIIEFGLLIKDYLALNQAAREGARSAALRSDAAVVDQRVRTSATTLDGTKVQVSPYYRIYANSAWGDWIDGTPPSTLPSDAEVQVRVRATYPHTLVTGKFFSWMVGGGDAITIGADMVMRKE